MKCFKIKYSIKSTGTMYVVASSAEVAIDWAKKCSAEESQGCWETKYEFEHEVDEYPKGSNGVYIGDDGEEYNLDHDLLDEEESILELQDIYQDEDVKLVRF